MSHDESTTNAMNGDARDGLGRTTAERVADVPRYGHPVTDRQRDDARRLLNAMLHAAQPFGITLRDFDWVTDLPGVCLDAVVSHERRSSL